MAHVLRGWLDCLGGGLLDLALPPRCAACMAGSSSAGLCGTCRGRLEPDPGSATPRYLDACVAAVAYQGDAQAWMQRFKYPGRGLASLDGGALAVACSLALDAALLARALPPDERTPLPDAVVPVPLHATRLRRRAFNPAALLAREIAREVGRPCLAAALRRIRDTPSQTGLDRRGRRRNVRGAFACPGPVPRRVWLVDDVVTTGATLSECARVLRRAGVRRVVGVCAARTPRPAD